MLATNKTNGLSLECSESLEGMVIWKTRPVFFQGGQNKTGGSSVQVEVCVEVDEHVERLV